MTISFNRTREQLAALVLGKNGVLAAGVSPRSADADLVYEAIDLKLKELHRLGIYWRKVDKVPFSFAVTASINSASATADILFPIALHIGSEDSPVELISVRQYAAISDKTATGIPEQAIWKGGAEFVFYPIPIASTTAKLIYERIADDTSAGAVVDVDVAFLNSLKDIICYELGDQFGQPEGKMQRWERRAEIAERNIQKLGRLPVDFTPVRVDNF